MKIVEKPDLPKEIIKTEAKPQLLAQAVRVYLANQRQGTQSALTRAEINRTRKKLYKQKGTGGARHGDRKAPIFVGGGITFAPKPRDYTLKLSDKMRKQALIQALSSKLKAKSLIVVSGMEKLTGKTKEIAAFLDKLAESREQRAERNLLIVTDQMRENIYRASRNITGVTVLPVNQINTYEVLQAEKVLLMEEAVKNLAPIKPKKLVTAKKKEAVTKEAPAKKAVRATSSRAKTNVKTKKSAKKATVRKSPKS